MSIEEYLTRLNPKTQVFTDSGGIGLIMTPQDLAAAMAGIDPVGEFVIRRKYIDENDKSPGYYQLFKESMLKVYEQDAIPKKKNSVQDLLDIALDESLGLLKCPICEGRGEVIGKGDVIRKCRSERCTDGNIAYLRDYERAKRMGVRLKAFNSDFRPALLVIDRYLREILPEAESRAIEIIKKRVK